MPSLPGRRQVLRLRAVFWACSSGGERLLCKQRVGGSNPSRSTKNGAGGAVALHLALSELVNAQPGKDRPPAKTGPPG